jgi:hypothetical protein
MALALLFVVVGNFAVLADETETAPICKACKFDGTDPSDCIIYGRLDDDVVEWSLGTDACRDNYGIFIKSIDPGASCDSASAFVNSIRFGDLSSSDSRLGLGVASVGGPFFVESSGTNALRVDLADSLNINGETIDCAVEADCYNSMKAYFENGDGAKEKDQVCQKLHSQVKVNKNLEESTLRIRLCQELREKFTQASQGEPVPVACFPLGTEVGDYVRADPDNVVCSSFGLETPLSQIEGCENHLSTIGAAGDGSSGGSFCIRDYHFMDNDGALRNLILVIGKPDQ